EAMAASPRKRLTIRAGGGAGGVELAVGDTGEGMDPEELPHLFQPFYTTKAQGIGLGLYLSDRIMREHGGRIEANSAKGKGTTFTLWFERQEKEESHAQLAHRG
ncbi:HAMP domain-containing histidine kinase, partial [Anoxybacillus sp. LAT_38]